MSADLPLFGDAPACAQAKPRQLGLPLGWARTERQLILGASLSEVARLLLDGEAQPPAATLLVGPPRSGRSLIGAVLTARGFGVIDDIERDSDEALFHGWNAARDAGSPLLLIAREDFAVTDRALPDLVTRLHSAHRVAIGLPDPCEIRARVDDAAARAGVPLADTVANYVAARIERSHDAIARACDAIAAHLAHGGSPSLSAIRALLSDARLIDPGSLAA